MSARRTLLVVVWDNECYQSIGGPPTHTAADASIWAKIAQGAGIENAVQVEGLDAFEAHCRQGLAATQPYVIVAKVTPDVRRDIKRKHSGRPRGQIHLRPPR